MPGRVDGYRAGSLQWSVHELAQQQFELVLQGSPRSQCVQERLRRNASTGSAIKGGYLIALSLLLAMRGASPDGDGMLREGGDMIDLVMTAVRRSAADERSGLASAMATIARRG
jgi:hypothetical protein